MDTFPSLANLPLYNYFSGWKEFGRKVHEEDSKVRPPDGGTEGGYLILGMVAILEFNAQGSKEWDGTA